MAYELLLKRIDEQLIKNQISERKALLNAGLGLKSVDHIRNRGHSPKIETLTALANELKVPSEYFLVAAAEGSTEAQAPKYHLVNVIGEIQAGLWQSAIQRNKTDWYPVSFPKDKRVPDDARYYGLEVKGPSMNLLYRPGTIVVVVPFSDLARTPENKEKVVVLRRSIQTDDFEATVKEYQSDGQGRHILWPRSDDPDYQAPIVLEDDDLKPWVFGQLVNPDWTAFGDQQPGGHVGNIIIAALVVGRIQSE